MIKFRSEKKQEPEMCLKKSAVGMADLASLEPLGQRPITRECKLRILAYNPTSLHSFRKVQGECMRILSMLATLVVLLLLGSPVLTAGQQPSPGLTNDEARQSCSGGGSTDSATLADRMPDIPDDKLTDAQKKVAAEFAGARGGERGGAVFGPYVALLRSPEVLLHMQRLGNYLQFKSVLPPKLRQFIMAITARQWTQEYMWSVHCPGALKAGINPETTKALAEGRRPTRMAEDEEIVYDFMDELHRNQSVSDKTYAAALAKFGDQGIIDLIGLNGYYTSLSMVLNATRHPLNKGVAPGLPMFPH
jgi:4-carboxymuconolactone decarboxylase